jgi:hypothetical protein
MTSPAAPDVAAGSAHARRPLADRAFWPILVAVVALLLVATTWSSLRLARNAKSQYRSAAVLRAVETYVTREQRWPGGWSDLGSDESATTRLRFDLDLGTASDAEIRAAIAPTRDGGRIYPNWDDDVARLIAACRAAAAPREAPATSGP